MNPVLLYCISGESLYSGVVVLLLIMAVSWLVPGTKLRLARNLGAWIALILIVMSASPFSLAAVIVFLFAFIFWYLAWNLNAARRRFRGASAVFLAAMACLAIAREYPHRRMPRVAGPPDDHLVVIGDSVSAGLNPLVLPWPVVLQRASGVTVRNLSRVGATTADGVTMADQLRPNDRVVLVEVGGNDLIAGLPATEFSKSLEVLLSKAAPGRTVAMMELPLLPNRVGYGRIQRQLASKYHVLLVPKRRFVDVISGSSATSDGIHLSQEGSQRMATLILQVFGPVLKPPDRSTTNRSQW